MADLKSKTTRSAQVGDTVAALNSTELAPSRRVHIGPNEFATVAEAVAAVTSYPTLYSRVQIKERANSWWDVVTGETADGYGVVAAGSKQLRLVLTNPTYLEYYGVNEAGDTSENAAAALSYASTAGLDVELTSKARFDNPVSGDGRQRVILSGWAEFTGPYTITNVSLIKCKGDGSTIEITSKKETKESFDSVLASLRVQNESSSGYGVRLNYAQNVDVSGFSIALGVISKTDGSGQSLGQWIVQSSPTDNTKSFGIFCQELNPINACQDEGYNYRRGLEARWSGGLQIVPESKDLARTGSTECYNTLFGLTIAPSSGENSEGNKCATYNGIMIEPGAIAQGGVGISAYGSETDSLRPDFALATKGHWLHGVDTSGGIFNNNTAIKLGNNQYISFENSEKTNTRKVFGVSDSDIVSFGAAKANGEYIFFGLGPSGNALKIKTLEGSKSYIQISPSLTGAPEISAQSSSIDAVDIVLKTKGAGHVTFGNHSSISSEVLTGYVEIKDSLGNVRKLAVIS